MYNTLTNELSKKEQDDIKNILKMVIDMFDRLLHILEIINMLPNSLQRILEIILGFVETEKFNNEYAILQNQNYFKTFFKI